VEERDQFKRGRVEQWVEMGTGGGMGERKRLIQEG
jgi:hypothetical protein